MPAEQYLSPGPPRVLAHRGFAVDEVENTAGAFRAAIDLGVTHIETDVHVTLDGVAVLWHDPDLRRFDGSSTPIRELSWAQLSEAQFRGARIQRLSDALANFPHTKINIDLKVEDAVEPVVAEIQANDAFERVLLTSFDDHRRRRAAAMLPGVATSLGLDAIARIVASRLWTGSGPRWARVWDRALADAVALQIPVRFRGVPVLSPALLREAHSRGVEVHIWTVNTPNRMRELLAMGVDGLITDRADLAITAIEEFAATR